MRTNARNVARRAAVLLGAALISMQAVSHIKNEATQYPDIEFSDARFDIVMLVGAGIIPETPVFEPDKPLSRRELATWAALARGLRPGGETPDTDELADAALGAGLVDSLDGEATISDLDTLFFGGAGNAANPDSVPTKAEAAAFIASHLDTVSGLALLQSRNLESGATGVVAPVETKKGHHGSVYVITVDETTLPMDAHGRVANGPTDLLQWEGRTVRRSFVRSRGAMSVWTYLEAQPIGSEAVEPAPDEAGNSGTARTDVMNAEEAGKVTMPPDDPFQVPVRLLGLVIAVLVLGFVLFYRRRP